VAAAEGSGGTILEVEPNCVGFEFVVCVLLVSRNVAIAGANLASGGVICTTGPLFVEVSADSGAERVFSRIEASMFTAKIVSVEMGATAASTTG
jgi:hypothetical protein